METRELLLENGNTVYYKVYNGTCYEYAMKLKDGTYEERDARDMDKIIKECELAHTYKNRVRLWYGDADTGKSWDEEYDVVGYIGHSTGPYSIPILLPNSKSNSGVGILTNRIIRIDDITSHYTCYKHPKFHVDPMEIKDEDNPELQEKGCFASVYQENRGCVARFKTRKQAENYIKFMNGERYCK